ncbi:MAG: UMP kinase [DPANN group archaeon]|nr:UMP kinase [DPANN group archaeon]
MVVVVSLGGSLVFDKKLDTGYLKKLARLLRESKKQYCITVGGGKISRDYISAAREFKENNFELDMIAIQLTKANARIAASAFGGLFFDKISEAADFIAIEDKTVVLGGTSPGQSTDTVAALLAEDIKAERFVNLSNVNGIYDKDPKKRGAKLIKKMTHKDLTKFAFENDERQPGKHFIIDSMAAKILERANIEGHFVNGKKWKDVKPALLGKPHSGTLVKN